MMGCFLSIFDEWMFKILKAIFGLGNGFIVWDLTKSEKPQDPILWTHPIPAKVVQLHQEESIFFEIHAQRVSIGIIVSDNPDNHDLCESGLDTIK